MERQIFKVTPDRYHIILDEIADGSEPGMRFYIMVAVSTMIASFGLITNSTAVIIGAMLVAPLMTPIFGIALALIRGDMNLLGKALRAEIVGVFAAVLMGFILGKLYPALEPTPEMLARTEPQLFDLLVAVFSGFAGAYALIDEKISPALPGVAIATAIVPPLANTGLCYSVGAYVGGVGSFLLFFANFLSILLVASVTFWFFGMTGRFSELTKKVLVRRFSLPVLCFILVTVFLTRTLVQIADNRHLERTIDNTLESELSMMPDTTFDAKTFNERDGKVYILADMNSSSIISPTQVSRLQNRLNKEIGLPVELVVRSRVARDISALGSASRVVARSLDGSFITQDSHPRVLQTKIADTVIRNFLSKYIGFELANVRVVDFQGVKIIVASIFGVAAPGTPVIEELELNLQQELHDPELKLVLRFVETKLYNRTGSVRFEFSGLLNLDEEQNTIVEEIIVSLKNELANIPALYISGISYNVIDGIYHFLLETNGLQTFSQEEVAALEKKVAAQAGVSTRIYVYQKPEIVVTSSGYDTYPTFSRTVFSKQRTSLMKTIQEVIKASNL